MVKVAYFAFLKAPANKTPGYYEHLPDTYRWLYEWDDKGNVRRTLQNHDGFSHSSNGAFIVPEQVEWNPDDFTEKRYPRTI